MTERFRAFVQIGYVCAIFIASFIFLDAAKYDTADRIWLVLLIGSSCAALPVLFGLRGVRSHPYLSVLLASWSVWLWISFINSTIQNYGFSEVLIFSWAALTAIFVSGTSEFVSKTLIRIILFAGVLSILYGFWYFPLHGEQRMAGLFFDVNDARHFFPNAFGTFLAMSWPLIFANGLKSNRWQTIFGALYLTALYLTYSRGAWLTVFLQIILVAPLAVKHFKKNSPRIIAAAMTAFLLILSLTALRNANFSTLSIKNKLTFAKTEQSTTMDSRKDFWTAALRITESNAVTGSGPMSFRYLYPSYQKHFLGNSDHPHNWLFKMSSENGVPAVLLFSAIIILSLTFAYRNFKNNPKKYLIAVAWIGALVHSMIDYNMNFIPNIATFFILLSLSWPVKVYVVPKLRITGQYLAIFLIICSVLLTAISMRELGLASWVKFSRAYLLPNERVNILKKSLLARDTIRSAAEQKIRNGQLKDAENFLQIHLEKNPLDAFGWYMLGDSKKSIILDPKNRLAYYRLYLEQNGNATADPITAAMKEILNEYTALLINNVYYTAFTDNAFEAEKIYSILGDEIKSELIRETASVARQKTYSEENFNKKFGPRMLRDLFVGN